MEVTTFDENDQVHLAMHVKSIGDRVLLTLSTQFYEESPK